jgi:hypothetical protein
MGFGATLLALSTVRIATGGEAGPRLLLFAAATWAAGAALVLWGWFRLQAAKAACPDLSWPKFLRDDLIALGIVVVLLGALAATPPTTRDDLTRSLLEFFHRLHVARGGP